jgi:hypothetical protein
MWIRAILIATLLFMAKGETAEYLDQIIEPVPQGGSFAAPYNAGPASATLSYLISMKHFTESPGELTEPPKVSARMFLGNSMDAGVRVLSLTILCILKHSKAHIQSISITI